MLEFRDAARDHVIQIASEIALIFDEEVGHAPTVADLVELIDLDGALATLAMQIRSICMGASESDLANAQAIIAARPKPKNPFKVQVDAE
jgi:hypothetical protein